MVDTKKAKKQLEDKANGDYTVSEVTQPTFTEEEKKQLKGLDKLLRELGLKK